MTLLSTRCAIAVMAKAPLLGRVKTRLVPPLSAQQALELSTAFLRDITGNIAAAGRLAPIDGWIAYAPAGEAARFVGMTAPGTQFLLADGQAPMPPGVEGLGRCLLQTMRELLAKGYHAVCVLNADSPTLPTGVLISLAQRLTAPGERAVLGPAEDGGYYALGMQAAHAGLFSGIAWSTDRVAEQTRARAREQGLPLAELPPWYDVDDAATLARVAHELTVPPEGILQPYPAPFTAACLARFGLDRGRAAAA